MIEVECEQGSQEWLDARAGACTASRFSVARERIGGLDEKQRAYVEAVRSGMPEKDAAKNAGYQKPPSAMAVQRALRGESTTEPSDAAKKYAMLLAIERIYGAHLDDTFKTWQMERGQRLEPVARELYERRTGYVVETAGILLTDDRMFGYSTDGKVYGQRGRVEIKVPSASDKVAGVWVNPEPIIAEHQDQCDGGLWMTRDEWIDLVIYTPWLESVGRDLFIHRIYRDEARIEALERDLMEFYRLTRDYEAKLRAPRDGQAEAPAPDAPPWEPAAPTPAPAAPKVAPQDIPEPSF